MTANEAERDPGNEQDMTGLENYTYLDATRDAALPAAVTAPDTPAVLNPAYYPKGAKPEALHNEAEQAGAEFPTQPSPKDSDVEDRHQTAEDIHEEYRRTHPNAPESVFDPAGRRRQEEEQKQLDKDKHRRVPAAQESKGKQDAKQE